MQTTGQAVLIIALVVASTGCATKGYVNARVGEVNDRVSSVAQEVEHTRQRTRASEIRIEELDGKAQAARERADAASRTAAEAVAASAGVDERVSALVESQRRLVYEVVLSADQARFAHGRATLTPEARAAIDEVVRQLAANPRNYYIEIEGHTDSTGSAATNERLGLRRAEAVKRYLYEQHQIPLHKMNVISFGETRPAVPNGTRANRAVNRRVVIKVLT